MPEFHHVALSCQSLMQTERFYTDHFGFQRARVISLGATQIVFLKAGSVYLELFEAVPEAGALRVPPGSPSPHSGDGPHSPGIRHLAFKVEHVDAKLAEMGSAAKVTLGPLDFDDFIPGWRTVWLADPDGNIVEISQGYKD